MSNISFCNQKKNLWEVHRSLLSVHTFKPWVTIISHKRRASSVALYLLCRHLQCDPRHHLHPQSKRSHRIRQNLGCGWDVLCTTTLMCSWSQALCRLISRRWAGLCSSSLGCGCTAVMHLCQGWHDSSADMPHGARDSSGPHRTGNPNEILRSQTRK